MKPKFKTSSHQNLRNFTQKVSKILYILKNEDEQKKKLFIARPNTFKIKLGQAFF